MPIGGPNGGADPTRLPIGGPNGGADPTRLPIAIPGANQDTYQFSDGTYRLPKGVSHYDEKTGFPIAIDPKDQEELTKRHNEKIEYDRQNSPNLPISMNLEQLYIPQRAGDSHPDIHRLPEGIEFEGQIKPQVSTLSSGDKPVIGEHTGNLAARSGNSQGQSGAASR